jgi:hypothetical protein
MPGDGLTHGPPATKKAGGSRHRISRINRHSLHDGFTAYSALSSETGLSCLRPPGLLTPGVDASVAASGPHAFAVRASVIRL